MVNLQKKFKQGSRSLVMVCLVLSVMSVPMLASAEVHYQVGVKSFLTDMKLSFTDANTLDTASYKSDNSVLLAGPSVKIMGDVFFAGATYLLPSEKLKFYGGAFTVDRQDLDVFVGMMPLRGENFKLGMVLGYKGIFLDYDYVSIHTKATSSFNGGMFGVPMSYRLPINAVPIVLYMTPAYGFLSEKYKNGDFSETSTYLGYSIDGGVNVGIWRGLSASLGYKYQAMDTSLVNSDVNKDDQKNEFQGVTFGVDYSF